MLCAIVGNELSGFSKVTLIQMRITPLDIYIYKTTSRYSINRTKAWCHASHFLQSKV